MLKANLYFSIKSYMNEHGGVNFLWENIRKKTLHEIRATS